MTSRAHRIGAAVAAALLILLAAGAPPAARGKDQPASGQDLYLRNCASCHGPTGGGTSQAPALSGAGPAAVDFQMRTGRMPLRPGEKYEATHRDPRLAPQEIDAIVDYVAELGIGGPGVPDVRPGSVQRGQMLYLATCAGCHSAAGIGGALSGGMFSPSLMRASPTEVGEAIRTGPGAMPRFPDTVLSDTDVNDIATYVHTLQERRGEVDRGGLNLGRIGPVTEGVVGWIVGLLLLVLVVRWLGSRAR